jgi:hypothetical protein
VDGAIEWLVRSETPREQQSDFQTSRAVDITQYQRDMDRLAIVDKEQDREIGRSIKVGYGETAPELDPGDEQVAYWGASGSPLGYITYADLAAALETPLSDLLDGFIGPKGDPGSAGEGYATRTLLATAGDSASSLDDAYLTENGREGKFIANTSDRSNRVAYDWAQAFHVAFAADDTGAGGAWQRPVDGSFAVEWGGTGTEAVLCAFSYFVQYTDFNTLTTRKVHTTRGFGDLQLFDENPVDLAAAQAAVGGYTEYDIVELQSDQSRYLVVGGELKKLSVDDGNGKEMRGMASPKRNGFKLRAGADADEPLLAMSISDFAIRSKYFNGDNPSSQWGGSKNNPLTNELVYLDGYSLTLDDVLVRFSGGDGMRLRGVVGNFELHGGQSAFNYNEGYGLVIDRMGGFSATRLWVEGNTLGGLLCKHTVDDSQPTQIAYYRDSNIDVRTVYYENALDTSPAVIIEGGHFGPRIGPVAQFGTGESWTYYLKNNATGDDPYAGCEGGRFDIGPNLDVRVKCETNAIGNLFLRQIGKSTSVEAGQCEFEDAGEDNVWEWDSLPQAYIPGDTVANLAANTGNSNFINNKGSYTVADLSLNDPALDWHSGGSASGPSAVVFDDIDTKNGGTQGDITLSLNYTTSSAGQHYIVLTALAQAYHNLRMVLYDSTNNEYYNWNSKAWTASGSADDYGIEKVVHADHRRKHFRLPFMADATARNVRVRIKATGPCEGTGAKNLILQSAFGTTDPNSALCGFRGGAFLGTPTRPQSTTANLPPAAALEGQAIYDTTTSTMKFSDGATFANI